MRVSCVTSLTCGRIRRLSILLALSLVSACFSSVSFAGVVSFDPPVQLDTTVTRYPFGSYGLIPPILPRYGSLPQPQNSLLLNLSPGPYMWSAWALDSAGELAEFGPAGLGSGFADSLSLRFTPFQVGASASGYSVYGTVTKDRKRYLASIHLDSAFKRAGPSTISSIIAPPGKWQADESNLWVVYRAGDHFSVFLYDNSLTVERFYDKRVNQVSGPGSSGSFYGDSSLYLSYQSTGGAVVCDRMDKSGAVTRLCVVEGATYNLSWPERYFLSPLANDSLLLCHLDTTTAGDIRLNCTAISRFAVNDTVSATQTVFSLRFNDIYPNNSFVFAVDGDEVWALPGENQGGLTYLRCNWRNGSAASTGVLTSSPSKFRGTFVGFRINGARGQYYYFDNTGLMRLDFSTADPVGDNSLSSVYYPAEYYRSPTMIRDGGDVLLYTQRASGDTLSLKGYHLDVSAGVTTLDSFTALGVDRKAYRPALGKTDSTKLLMWYEDVTAFDPSVPADTSFLVKIVSFAGDYPTAGELANTQDVFYAPRSYDYRPSFVQIGDYVYFDGLRWLYPGYYDDGHIVRLHRLNARTGELSATYKQFDSDGKLGLLGANDTLTVVRSWYTCNESTGPNQDACLRRAGGYDLRYFSDFRDAGRSALYFGNGEISDWETLDANARVWSDLNGSVILTSLRERAYLQPLNATTIHETANLTPYSSSLGAGADFHPISIGEYNCALALSADKLDAALMVFDRRWQFIESATVPLLGSPLGISEIVPLYETNELLFAYSSFMPERFGSARVILQKLRLDITTDVNDDNPATPRSFELTQNYPNPFNPETTISFSLPRAAHVTLNIYNLLGQKVTTLASGRFSPGAHRIAWDGRNKSGSPVASGVYFYRLTNGTHTASRKMLLLR